MGGDLSAQLPPVAELLPHTGPMRLLERVLAHDADATRCLVDPARSRLFADATGRVPVWVAIEYMAQCIAVHGNLVARARGEGARRGLLLGSRRLHFRCDAFAPGRLLEVTAHHAAGRARTLAFECTVIDPDGGGAPLAEGRLHVLPERDPPAQGPGAA